MTTNTLLCGEKRVSTSVYVDTSWSINRTVCMYVFGQYLQLITAGETTASVAIKGCVRTCTEDV